MFKVNGNEFWINGVNTPWQNWNDFNGRQRCFPLIIFKVPNGGFEKWRSLIASKEYSDMFAEKYVKEFCTRYGANEYLFSIDIINEPDWIYENEGCGNIPWEDLSYFSENVRL